MGRATQFFMVLGCAVLLHACGGSGDSAPMAVPPPPAPVQLALTASNYQDAFANALETANAAFGFAKLGADSADRIFNVPLVIPPVVRCPVSGTATIELSDRNRNGALDENDSVHIFLTDCNSSVNPLTGVVRVEVVSAAQIAGGRDYQFNVTINNLVIASTVAGIAPVTINFTGFVDFTRTADLEHYVVSSGEYDFSQAGQTRSAHDLLVDYLQRHDTLEYDYQVQGSVEGSAIQGRYRVTTPTPLTGLIGAYPGGGRIDLNGGANSSARLSEEGTAAGNGDTVRISVDTNGDGTAEASVPELAWSALLPAEFFMWLRDQAAATVLPLP